MELESRQDCNKAVTLKDIAEECGVNVGTVSRALRNDGRLCKATIERIKLAAKTMGYDASRHQIARRLAMSRYGQPILNYMIGLFFHHGGFAQSRYFFKMLQGVLSSIRETDFEFCTSDQAMVQVTGKLPMPYRSGDIDGALIMAASAHAECAIERLRDEPNFGNRPIVGMIDRIEGAQSVYPDNYSAGRQIVDHLLELGHQGIIHFHGHSRSKTDVHSQRLTAFEDAFTEAGLDLSGLRMTWWNYDRPSERAISLCELLREEPRFTAIVAHDGEHAVTLYDALTKAGFRVPEDISLIGYDDTDPVYDDRGNNILTTVKLPLFEIGQQATQLMMKKLLGREIPEGDIVLPTEMILRRSTAPPNPSRR